MFSQQCNSGFCLAICALRCWVDCYVFLKEGVAFIVKGPVGALEDGRQHVPSKSREPLAQWRTSMSQKNGILM